MSFLVVHTPEPVPCHGYRTACPGFGVPGERRGFEVLRVCLEEAEQGVAVSLEILSGFVRTGTSRSKWIGGIQAGSNPGIAIATLLSLHGIMVSAACRML
jgi:hypothetical protein